MRHLVNRGASYFCYFRWASWGGVIPVAFVICLVMTASSRAADPPPADSLRVQITSALKPGQPASQRLGAVILIGELTADPTIVTSLSDPNAYADKIADLAANDPDASVREAALFALGRMNPMIDDAIAPLRATLLNTDKTRTEGERRTAAATVLALATTLQQAVGTLQTGSRTPLRRLRVDGTYTGTVADASAAELTVNMSAGFQDKRKFKVTKDTLVLRKEAGKTEAISIPLDDLKKDDKIRIVAHGPKDNLQASRIDAYETYPPEATPDIILNQIPTGAALVPLTALAMSDKDPVIRRRGAAALLQIARELKENLQTFRIENRLAMTRPIFDALHDASGVLADAVNDPDPGDKNEPSPAGLPTRALACQTIQMLEIGRLMLPESAPPPAKQEANPKEEEPALSSAPSRHVETTSDLIFGDPTKIVGGLERILLNRQGRDDIDVRIDAAQALEALGLGALPAMPALVDALHDPNPIIRWIAARTMGKVESARLQAKLPPVKGAEGAVDALIGLIYDPDPDVRGNLDSDAQIAAIVALGSFDLASAAKDAENAVHALGEVVAVGDFSARLAALTTLKSLWGQRVTKRPSMESLGRALTYRYSDIPSPKVQIAAAELLGLYGPAAADAVPTLRGALRDPDARVRRAAAEALLNVTRSIPK